MERNSRPVTFGFYLHGLVLCNFTVNLARSIFRNYICLTRLPSNLTPTTCERMHLVARGHFQSHDKDGGHTIWSIITKNLMIHANLMALSFIELELWAIKFLHCGNRDFQLFCLFDLVLDPMMYELDPYYMVIYHMCKYELLTSRLSKVITWQTYIQMDTTEIIIQCFVGGQQAVCSFCYSTG